MRLARKKSTTSFDVVLCPYVGKHYWLVWLLAPVSDVPPVPDVPDVPDVPEDAPDAPLPDVPDAPLPDVLEAPLPDVPDFMSESILSLALRSQSFLSSPVLSAHFAMARLYSSVD